MVNQKYRAISQVEEALRSKKGRHGLAKVKRDVLASFKSYKNVLTKSYGGLKVTWYRSKQAEKPNFRVAWLEPKYKDIVIEIQLTQTKKQEVTKKAPDAKVTVSPVKTRAVRKRT